jgi:hypothetical protein
LRKDTKGEKDFMHTADVLEASNVQELEIPSDSTQLYNLCDVEIETVRRAAFDRGLPFEPDKTIYSFEELSAYGIVREGYNRAELRARGITPTVVSSLDQSTFASEMSLPLATPFGSGVQKYELPIDMLPIRIAKTVYSPGSVVTRHVHPPHSEESPGGGVRIVASGYVLFGGRKHGPGDWFFTPNGTPYEFSTDPGGVTIVFYSYSFFGAERGNRFSHPAAR